MPTIEEEKPAKPRPRNRKTADQRTPKAEQRAQAKAGSGPVGPTVAPIEAGSVVAEPLAIPLEAVTLETKALEGLALEGLALEQAPEAALSGEVLPPEVRDPVPPAAGLPAIAQAYDDYTRKSWAASRFLVERLIAARSIDEAIEIQGEFAKQAYANFVSQSQRICVLYGEWAQQFFAPITTGWTRIGR